MLFFVDFSLNQVLTVIVALWVVPEEFSGAFTVVLVLLVVVAYDLLSQKIGIT